MNDQMVFTLHKGDTKVALPERQVIDLFHSLYYLKNKQTWENTRWMGWPLLKCPLDLWIYQEIMVELNPDIIIETGTYHGGSAFYFASIMDRLNKGRVITIDIVKREPRPSHPRVTYLSGSSTAPEIVEQAQEHIKPGDRVMVILDSDHSKQHVFNELKIYSELVTVGSYLIVEDTNINGHPVYAEFGPGPMEAMNEFLTCTSDYVIDKSREKFMMTQNPSGYLKKVK